MMVCFPQCDTNPMKAGNLETLTQRYWEAMLSGWSLIILNDYQTNKEEKTCM